MALSDTRVLKITPVLTGLVEALRSAMQLNSDVLLELKKDGVLEITSVEFWGHSKSYHNHPHTIRAIKRFRLPYTSWASGTAVWTNAVSGEIDAAAGTYWNGGGNIYGIFNARTLVDYIHNYTLSDDGDVKLTITTEIASGRPDYYMRSIGFRSGNVTASYQSTTGPDVKATSSDYTYDNSPGTKVDNVQFMLGMKSILEGDTGKTFKETLGIAGIKNLRSVYKSGNLLFDISKVNADSPWTYFQNYTIPEKQYEPFTMGMTGSTAFTRSGFNTELAVLDGEINFTTASLNNQITSGPTSHHTLYAPEFSVQYLDCLAVPISTWGYESFEFTAFRKAPHVPGNGMGGHTNPERRWLRINTPAGTSTNKRYMELVVNEFTNPYYLIADASNNTNGRWVDIPEDSLIGTTNEYSSDWT